MLPTEPEGYISIIASNFVFPIASLFKVLDRDNSNAPNEVQASPFENGYSLAIATLTVLMVESAISRTQYIMKNVPPQRPLEFVKQHFEDKLFQRVEEIFVLRDTIAHNHVWEARFFWDEHGKMKLVDAQLVEGYGDKKYGNTVEYTKRKTKILDLNVFPNRICRSDAVTVLKTAFDFLTAMEKQDNNYFNVTALVVKYKGYAIPFSKFVSEIT